MESTQATPVVIAPRRGWVGPGLRELWEHRDLGFFLFNKAKPLKRIAMRHAMGVVGDLPRLVRGLPL